MIDCWNGSCILGYIWGWIWFLNLFSPKLLNFTIGFDTSLTISAAWIEAVEFDDKLNEADVLLNTVDFLRLFIGWRLLVIYYFNQSVCWSTLLISLLFRVSYCVFWNDLKKFFLLGMIKLSQLIMIVVCKNI